MNEIEKEALYHKYEAQLDELDAKEAEFEANKRMEYEDEKQSFKEKLEEWKDKGEEEWEEFKDHVEVAWKSLREKFSD